MCNVYSSSIYFSFCFKHSVLQMRSFNWKSEPRPESTVQVTANLRVQIQIQSVNSSWCQVITLNSHWFSVDEKPKLNCHQSHLWQAQTCVTWAFQMCPSHPESHCSDFTDRNGGSKKPQKQTAATSYFAVEGKASHLCPLQPFANLLLETLQEESLHVIVRCLSKCFPS